MVGEGTQSGASERVAARAFLRWDITTAEPSLERTCKILEMMYYIHYFVRSSLAGMSINYMRFIGGFVMLAVACVVPVSASAASRTNLYAQASGGACVNISRDLARGSRGADVTALQRFLVSRNYPGGGTWMITGYYGAATATAVRNFQTAQALPATGVVDLQTRLALDMVACGTSGSSLPIPAFTYSAPGYDTSVAYTQTPLYTATVQPSYSYYPQYGIGQGCVPQLPWSINSTVIGTYFDACQNAPTQQYGAPQISSLSPVSGSVGTNVTIRGTGFTPNGNTVHFGNGIITGLLSNDGRSVSFTVPANLSGYGAQATQLGTYPIAVTNAYGATTASVPFAVTSLGTSASPSITSLSGPSTLGVGAVGQWSFTVQNPADTYATVSVQWGDQSSVTSSSQQIAGTGMQTVSFSHAYTQSGTYTPVFTVTSASGKSTMGSATVTVSGSNTNGLTITSVTPSVVRVGSQIVIQGSGFSTYDNTVRFGSGGTQHVPSYNGTTIYYTIPQYLSPCDVAPQGTVCAQYVQMVTPGSYQLAVSNGSNTSSSVSVTVQQ